MGPAPLGEGLMLGVSKAPWEPWFSPWSNPA